MAFRDGLGERRPVVESDGPGAEALRLRRDLAVVPSFEFALRERVNRLATFRHSYYARVRSVDRSTDPDQALTITSDATPGVRLSELLTQSHDRGLILPIDAALCLVRQLVPAVAILHETARDAAHGAIAPERLIVGPNNRLVVTEYVLGSALEQLLFSRERYWADLRIALPRVAGLPRFDHLADVTQIGVVALQLVLGRLLRDDEYPAGIADVVSNATAVSQSGPEPLAAGLKGWLNRALQLDPRHSFPSAIEARADLDRVIAESGYEASPESLDAFLARYQTPDAAQTVVEPLPVRPMAVPEIIAPVVAAVAARVAPAPAPLPVAIPGVPQPVAVPVAASRPTPAPVPPPVPVREPAVTPFLVSMPAVSEEDPAEIQKHVELPAPPRRTRGRLMTIAAAAIVVLVILAGGGLLGAKKFFADEPGPEISGTLVIATNPSGAEALVDGIPRGMTPVTLSLSIGPHKVELRGTGEPRVLPITMTAGAQISQYVDLPHPAAPVLMEPAAVTPPPAAPAADDTLAMAGWIAVQVKSAAPDQRFEVDVYENDRLLGSSRVDRIMAPAGRHELELVNTSLGLRVTRTLQVTAGKVSTIAIDPPASAISVNALPWAEVWVDGAKVGETPIGNFPIAVGTHDLMFKHPDFGERHQSVVVTLTKPTRISVDLRKP